MARWGVEEVGVERRTHEGTRTRSLHVSFALVCVGIDLMGTLPWWKAATRGKG